MKTLEHEYTVSSTHHQAQYPWRMPANDFFIFGWTEGMLPSHEDGDGKELINGVVKRDWECEIVYYPRTCALGIQPHPEYQYGRPEHEPFITYLRGLLNKLIEGTL